MLPSLILMISYNPPIKNILEGESAIPGGGLHCRLYDGASRVRNNDPWQDASHSVNKVSPFGIISELIQSFFSSEWDIYWWWGSGSVSSWSVRLLSTPSLGSSGQAIWMMFSKRSPGDRSSDINIPTFHAERSSFFRMHRLLLQYYLLKIFIT